MPGNVGVLLGKGDGTFTTSVIFAPDPKLEDLFSVVAADLNGDGKPDLVVSASCEGGVCYIPRGEGGAFINTSIGATTTALTSSLNPSNIGQSITFTATMTAAPFFRRTPTGTVGFSDGTTLLANVPLNPNGVETLATAKLAVGTHRIEATYHGDPNFMASTSTVLSQVVRGAIAQLSATSLNFGNQTVNVTGAAKSVTLTNKGNIVLTISSIAITGTDISDFVRTTNCSSSIAPNGTCTISVTFKPTATGTRTASVSITDNASNSPQRVSLAGVGVLPEVVLSPTSLNFPTQVVFTASKAQTVKLTNSGLGVLKITNVVATAPFSQTNNCGSTVNQGASCTITVTFHSPNIGSLSGSVSVTDNAPASPQKITLKGTGTAIQLSPLSLKFGTQPVGTTSLSQTITLSNKRDAAVSITAISIIGADANDFHQTHTCGTTVASGASCFIKVTFKPLAKGTRTATVSVSDNGGGSPQKVPLSGTGT